jgi:hypothetical protein
MYCNLASTLASFLPRPLLLKNFFDYVVKGEVIKLFYFTFLVTPGPLNFFSLLLPRQALLPPSLLGIVLKIWHVAYLVAAGIDASSPSLF